ncbi:hypothetical protein [Microbacterium arborescens]|uniref:hypothetical protein n=1 Tax=Microbacterium arborescens TaxID=33883 RepID=UPI00277D6B03|nr:hypothetical protein [Microbacterium arborescens]MDQ1217986.1 hypothetical protein [Microbacterium arborescens]
MSTPAEHRTKVQEHFAKKALHRSYPDETHMATAEVHAILASKAGTGDAYATADALLAADAGRGFKVHDAKLHALLAD